VRYAVNVCQTDNTSILGLTIDYGPFGFLDSYNPSYTPNTTDIPGRRYRYETQPLVVHWNIHKLASALAPLCGAPDAQAIVNSFDALYMDAYGRLFAKKLGISSFNEEDRKLVDELCALMQAAKADMTNTWRSLSNVRSDSTSQDLNNVYGPLIAGKDGVDADKWAKWMQKYQRRIIQDTDMDDESRCMTMNATNPVYILRNYMAQEAIDAAENGDFSVVQDLYEILRNPYKSQVGAERYTSEPPSWASRPGVCVNSCSS
jgi:serine/tyrosine/threonine adenylyltransferase